MTPSDPSATLEAIKDRAGVVAKLGPPRPGGDLINAAHRSAADVPRLVAAVEAVLKLHQPVTTNGGWLEGREWQECGECGPNNGQENIYAMPGRGESFWPCPTVEAITREITRKGAGDERARLRTQPGPDDPRGQPPRTGRHPDRHPAAAGGGRPVHRRGRGRCAPAGPRDQADAARPAERHAPRRDQVRHRVDARHDRAAYLVAAEAAA